MSDWQPIDTAPKDRPIWVYYDHDEDPGWVDDTMTEYCCYAEAGVNKTGKGQVEAVWFDGEIQENEYNGDRYLDPGWWFINDGDGTAINATHWRELPPPPKQGSGT